ncbi:trypsin domain-containing protein [Phthorimaea operculella]|nr:trypsin domain-containing protein [Phthorimaea operculella]
MDTGHRPDDGRPRYRWKDMVEADLGYLQVNTCLHVGQDRDQWRKLVLEAKIYFGSLNNTNQNETSNLEDVGLPETKTELADIDDRDTTERTQTVANNSMEDNLNEEGTETPVPEEENLSQSNDTSPADKMQGKIFGGDYADIHDFPHSAFIMAHCNAIKESEYWMCGGSVLTQQHILTAAHCVYGCRGSFKIDILAGSANYEQAKVLREARRLTYHRQYRNEGVLADIGLVLLDKALPLNKEISRIWIKPSFPDKAEGYMAGWGVTDEKGTMTTKLKMVRQDVWKLSKCLQFETLEPGTFCATSGSKKHYALGGDSGSALVVPSHQQLGLVSYREERYPELIIYTNVSYYYNWIKDMAYTLSCKKL